MANGFSVSTKLGIAGLISFGLTVGLMFSDQAFGIILTCAIAACIFAGSAAHRGSKWWLLIPGVIVGYAVLLLAVLSQGH